MIVGKWCVQWSLHWWYVQLAAICKYEPGICHCAFTYNIFKVFVSVLSFFYRRGCFSALLDRLMDHLVLQTVECFLLFFLYIFFRRDAFSLAGQDSLIGWFCRRGVQPEELATGRGRSLLRQPDSGHG